jgi:hypothetical protein
LAIDSLVLRFKEAREKLKKDPFYPKHHVFERLDYERAALLELLLFFAISPKNIAVPNP